MLSHAEKVNILRRNLCLFIKFSESHSHFLKVTDNNSHHLQKKELIHSSLNNNLIDYTKDYNNFKLEISITTSCCHFFTFVTYRYYNGPEQKSTWFEHLRDLRDSQFFVASSESFNWTPFYLKFIANPLASYTYLVPKPWSK